MKLINIDKTIYKQRLNVITIAIVAALAVLSVGFGSVLIAFFGSQNPTAESTGNFHLNLMGVIAAAFVCVAVLSKLKNTPYFKEVYYVWRLKALQNRIYRRIKPIKQRVSENDRDAIVVLFFYYHSLKQVYSLDNNTLTLSELEKNIQQLQAQIDSLSMDVDVQDFDTSLI
ncbi:DUF3087 domain-containing protein [Vibrio methylphosphonaticus]|uniref:DUF3087 domain-containing protein n=1 Tax=Vibrio methylphosphonaticus TaxID=2946866 RepID=UPI002029D80F|nr:DUF3087 domain-containing protein [Vibrio methylphosphonaticus]MCL9773977.1 DUF3087 domain-containing protein [Vibrio methylphosphonaticus]